MAINWDEVNSQYSGNFKPFVEDGKFTVKLEKVEFGKVTPTGSYPLNFLFEEYKEVKFPKVTEWISFKQGKDNWRYHRMSQLMQFFKKSEADAHKGVEFAESKSGNEEIAKGYLDCFKRIASLHPEVEIEVTTDNVNGKEYARGDWADKSIRMGNNSTAKTNGTAVDVILNKGETVSIADTDEVPF